MDGKTGFLAEPDDLDDFVEKIIELLTNEDRRRQFSANARQWVAERFDLTPKVVETVKTFRETLSLPT
jgi:trehalose synthase